MNAQISMDNGQTIVDVDSLTTEQLTLAIEVTETRDADLREHAHAAWLADPSACSATYLAEYCREHLRRFGEVFTIG